MRHAPGSYLTRLASYLVGYLDGYLASYLVGYLVVSRPPPDLSYRAAVGSIRVSCSRRLMSRGGAVAVAALAFVGCTSDPEPELATVGPENAFVAVVQWEIEQTDPVVDEDGNVEPPVIYLAGGSGETVEVGVQANVVATVDDAAIIRFVDLAADALDESVDGEPVKDDGVLLVVDAFESGQPTVAVRVLRYRSIDDDTTWILELTATDDGVDVTEAVEADDPTT